MSGYQTVYLRDASPVWRPDRRLRSRLACRLGRHKRVDAAFIGSPGRTVPHHDGGLQMCAKCGRIPRLRTIGIGPLWLLVTVWRPDTLSKD